MLGVSTSSPKIYWSANGSVSRDFRWVSLAMERNSSRRSGLMENFRFTPYGLLVVVDPDDDIMVIIPKPSQKIRTREKIKLRVIA